MTFPLQKLGGFVDVHSEVTPAIMTAIDLNLSRAVDGTAGGTWVGANTWSGNQTFSACTVAITGAATVNLAAAARALLYGEVDLCGQTIMTGTDARMRWRQGTLGNADTDLTAAVDIYRITTFPVGGAKTYTLKKTGAVVPSGGERIRVYVDIAHNTGVSALFKNEAGTTLATIPSDVANINSFVEFEFVAGDDWHCCGCGGVTS